MKTNRGRKKGALLAVFFTVLIDLMGFGIVLPLLPYTAQRFDASPVWVGLLFSIYSLSQLVFSPVWGGWSDKIGRRPIMLLSTFGSCLSYLLFCFSGSFGILFLSRLLAGVMGGNISAAQSYVTDVTREEDRSKGMGLIGAAFGIGFAAGPALASLLVKPQVQSAISASMGGVLDHIFMANPYLLPGLAAALLSAVSFALVLVMLPESLRTGEAAPAEAAKKPGVFSSFFWRDIFLQGPMVKGLYVCSLIIAVGHSTLYSAFPLYCSQRLRLGADKTGILFLWMGLVAVLVQGGMIRPLVKKFGELKLFWMGNILMVAGMVMIGAAETESSVRWAIIVLSIGGSLNGPTLLSLISKKASLGKIGLAMGNAQSVSALGRVIGPAWGGWLFGAQASSPFFLTASLLTMAVIIGFFIRTPDES